MSISLFTTNFEGGTRKNRFKVKGTGGAGLADNFVKNLSLFHIVAAAMPASIITTNPIDFRGRRILYPGDRVYSAEGFNVWTVTIQDDIPGQPTEKITNLWNRLHAWSNGINSHVFNTGTPFSSPPIPYETTISVQQLNLNGTKVIKESTLYGAWPQSISPLNMEMQARDQYNTFDVTFCFKYTDFVAAG